MNVAIIGLGKMGSAVAQRVQQGGHTVVGFDPSVQEHNTITVVNSIEELAQKAHIFWLMVPAGQVVDNVINQLLPHIQEGAVIVDAGNSKFTDSLRRAQTLQEDNIAFLDCGTSGGIHGLKHGFSLMVGGDKNVYQKLEPLFNVIAAPNGYGYVGPSGAGHYVKMVHNGIEYALLQAYAEGFELIKNGSFKKHNLDLQEITRIWQNGSVVRSFILDLAHEVFKDDQQLTNISGEVAEGGTGKWTVQDAHKHDVPVKLIEESLNIRKWSRETGGNYATKVIAMLRKGFGGHEVKKIDES